MNVVSMIWLLRDLCETVVVREREGGKGGGSERELRGGDIPSRRVSPFTLLSYKGGYHSRSPQGRRGGGIGPWVFFFPLLSLLRVMCCHPRRPEMGGPGRGVSDGRVGGR